MQSISIVIPTLNEEQHIEILIKRISKAFVLQHQSYEIIFVDDHSTDNTLAVIERLSHIYPVRGYLKRGNRGKAYSLIEGFAHAKYQVLGMIDADLQYAPEEIPAMIAKIGKNVDIVVANRKYYQSSFKRKCITNTFRHLFGTVLFGLHHDIQSGLKIFKKEVLQTISFQAKSPWTFDLEFLHRATNAGFRVVNHDITFYPRKEGKSNVSFLRTSWEIGSHALQMRLKTIQPIPVAAIKKETKSMVGSGFLFKKRHYVTHTTLHHHASAVITFHDAQRYSLIALCFLLLFFFIWTPLKTLLYLVALLSTVYFIDVLFNFYLVWRSLFFVSPFSFNQKELHSFRERDLPIYSILCPLYKEAHVIPQFVEAIAKIDWPKEKLDVMLLLEEDDTSSINAVKTMKFPSFVRIVIVPDSLPKTKPKACNYGLNMARGSYLVIYDAEDVPETDQLRKAYLAFKHAPKDVLCVQAKLNYYNPHHNLLTKLFTAEYSLWFDVSLTGLQALNTTIPLGGTSNHFRTKDIKRLQGWDPFNVTEDADLGIRLFNEGYKTAIIDSTTYEEANSRVKNWIRQRSRWIKGYMQTYLVHTRKSIGFQGKEPKHALLFHLLMGGKISFILINPFLWIATISYFVLNQYVGETIEYLYPSTVFYMAVTSLVFGNFLFIYYYMIGVIKREQWNLVKYVLLIPFYWILISVAGYMAIYQLLFKPHYWEKTIHGFHLKKAFDEAQKNNNIEEASIKRNREIKKYSMLVRAGLSLRKLKYIIISNSKDFIDIFSKNKKMRKNEDTLRILIFNWRDTKHVWAGGAEAYVHEIAKRWVADGMSVTLFCGNDGHEARNQVIDGVRVIRRGGFFTVYFWAFIYYIFRLRGKYDVIIDAENGIPFLTPLYVRKPIYLLIHHVHQDIFRLHLSFPLAQIASFLEGKVMPFLYRKRTVITVSESSRNEIIKLGFDVESIHVIHPGINREQFFSIEKAEHPVFSYIGRLKPYKNINTLIYAMQRVVEQNPRAKLFIAGDGECESEMRELVQKLHMEKHIFIMGKITEKQKTQLFGYSWAAIQPSQVEGWGITVIEANACSTPVIASNVNGLRDSIIDKKTGILVEVNSIDKLAEAMIALITGSDLRKQLSKEAYRWSQKFHWDESARLFIMLIRGTEVL